MLTDDPVIAAHIQELLRDDPVFSRAFPKCYRMERAKGEDGIAGLLRIVIGQQVSTAAARSLWGKFNDRFDPYDTAAILAAADEDLRACGLSRQKIGYIRGLASAIQNQDIVPESWYAKDSEAVIAEITALKGFGLWSAQMFLMFNLARPDIWPHGDLGIQSGVQLYLDLPTRPTEKETKTHGALFKGRETAAALLLWSLKDGGV